MEPTNQETMISELRIINELGRYITERRIDRLNMLIERDGLTSPLYESIRDMYKALDINQN